MSLDETAQKQREHWRRAVQAHVGTPQAVGSESMSHKLLRYAKLAELFSDDVNFTLHDVGPGIGDFYKYLFDHYPNRDITYSASEITEEYCEIARAAYPELVFLNRNIISDPVDETYDYVVLGGVFHQKGDVRHYEWVAYMEELLTRSFELARKGVAFNVLSSYADFYNPGNYYANLAEVQTYIVRRLSRFFRMDHAYPLFEATFYIYRDEYICGRFPQSEFRKYIG